MNLDAANAIADAVLYEGHILYPYRPSSRKNRVRWTFGGVHPRAYSEASGGTEACRVRAQVLARATAAANYGIRVRFLHLLSRQVLDAAGQPVEAIEVAGRLYQTWEEASERLLEVRGSIAELVAAPRQVPIRYEANASSEVLGGEGASATLERAQVGLQGTIMVTAEWVRDGVARLTVEVVNETPIDDPGQVSREVAMRHSLVSTHVVLGVDGGELVSMTDPPEELVELAAACQNIGLWPVLVGEGDSQDVVLASPIILEDHPRIAPESPGSLFDGTEIDEILTLRIMTMTDEEKAEARASDDAVRALLDRTDALTPEELMRMHGTRRSLRGIETSR